MGLALLLLLGVGVYALISYLLSLPTLKLTNKTVLITGCDTGMGRMLARYLYERGWHVFANCLTETSAESLKKEFLQLSSASSAKLTTLVFSVTDEEAVKRNLQEVATQCPRGLWGVVNNAGVSFGHLVEFNDIEKDYRRVMDVNFFGMVAVTKYALPLIRQAKGRVVNMTSLAGKFPTLGLTSYCASKHAGEAFSDGLRQELKPFGVHVSIIEPGFMKTQIVATGMNEAQKVWESDAKLSKLYNDAWGYQVKFKLPPMGDPQKVVDAYHHALTAVYPKSRYQVGLQSKISVLLITYVPSFIIDILVTKGFRRMAEKI